MVDVECPYCSLPADFVTGKVIYPHRKDLWVKNFYRCGRCHAYVGCHGESDKPLGRLANADLRRAKMRAHNSFDPVWKCRLMQRREAYTWLAGELNIPVEHCHIGMFNELQCAAVVVAVERKFGRL